MTASDKSSIEMSYAGIHKTFAATQILKTMGSNPTKHIDDERLQCRTKLASNVFLLTMSRSRLQHAGPERPSRCKYSRGSTNCPLPAGLIA